MRNALSSLSVAGLGAAAVAAAGWGVQAVALSAPPPAAQVGADAEAWFHYYRFSVDVFHVREHRIKGECMRGWWLHSNRAAGKSSAEGGLLPGSLLVLTNGPVVLASGKHRVRDIYDPDRIGLPNALAAAIGCTGTLSEALALALQSGVHLSIEATHAANQPAVALEFRIHDERLTLYLAPRGYRPLVVLGALGGQIASVRIYLSRVTPTRAAQYRHLSAQGLQTQRHGNPDLRRARPA